MRLSNIYEVYPKETTQLVDLQLEGMPTPALKVFRDKSLQTLLLVVRLTEYNGIYGIEVRDPRCKTAEGIGVGSTLGDLRRLHKDLSTQWGEGCCDSKFPGAGYVF
jgi:hypothetical protein